MTNSPYNKTKRICFMGLMFAAAVTLSYLEGLVSVPGLPPGVKLGLSNIVSMYCVFFLGAKDGYTIAVLKAFSVFLMRGPTGAFLLAVWRRWPCGTKKGMNDLWAACGPSFFAPLCKKESPIPRGDEAELTEPSAAFPRR